MGNEEEHFQQSDPPILPILQLKMLPSLSSWAAVHCGLLVLTQQFLAANTQSKPFHLLQSTYAVNTYDIPVTTDLFQKFVCYARFSAASYAYSCPNPPYGATVANFFNVASTDTQGYLFETMPRTSWSLRSEEHQISRILLSTSRHNWLLITLSVFQVVTVVK
jgi:hypothetical protein